MLRVCALPDYRYSEDLDFDWRGSPNSFHNRLSDALDEAAQQSGAELALALHRGPNPRVLWRDQGHNAAMKAEATFVSEHDMPIRSWSVRPNHPDILLAPPIRRYELVSVVADKLSCISRRMAPRDFYDLNSLLLAGEDLDAAWLLYVAHAQHPERQYGRRPHPSDIRASYPGRRSDLAAEWERLVKGGQLPLGSFEEAFANVDDAVRSALNQWKQQLPTGELHRLKQQYQQRRKHLS